MPPPPEIPPELNVLMVNTYQTGGGAARVGQLLGEGLAAAGHRVNAFVAGNPARHPSCHVVRHWRCAPLARWLHRHGFPELGEVTSLFWHCRQEFAASDVLHLHNLHGEYVSLAALPLWGLDKPIVWTLHDFWALTGNCAAPRACDRWRRSCGQCPLCGVYPMAAIDRSRFYRWLKPRLFVRARPRLVAPSHWLAQRVRELPVLGRLPLRVIPNPVDCDLFAPRDDRRGLQGQFGLAPGTPTIVMVGQNWVDPLKGGQDALAALAAARPRLPRVQLLVIGAGSNAILSHSGLPGRALPVQQRPAVLANAYACADVCLFPSRAENYPLTTLEALACGTPAVAYDVGGVPEQIEHGRTGWLARDGHPEELAAGIAALAGNPAMAREMGRAGRAFVLRTNALSVVVPQYIDEYGRAAAAWSRRHRRPPRCQRGALAVRVARVLGWEETPPRVPVHRAAPLPQAAWGEAG